MADDCRCRRNIGPRRSRHSSTERGGDNGLSGVQSEDRRTGALAGERGDVRSTRIARTGGPGIDPSGDDFGRRQQTGDVADGSGGRSPHERSQSSARADSFSESGSLRWRYHLTSSIKPVMLSAVPNANQNAVLWSSSKRSPKK